MATLSSLPVEFIWFVAAALVVSAPGFYKTVYFISTGYAFSIALIAGLSMTLFAEALTPLALAHGIGLLLYGLRLGSFLVQRELTSTAYQRELEEAEVESTRLGLAAKMGIWLGVALLYVCMAAPLGFVLTAPQPTGGGLALQGFGVSLLFGGLLLETMADHQKSVFKRAQPRRFCDVGLYRRVRCPNYLGEVTVWIGSTLAGVAAYDHGLRWVVALIGLVCIVLIMVGSTRRLEIKQDERYGDREDYREYRSRTPILWPGVPVYSFRNARIYLG
jgi:steroid 5-alpha reductase family enzyme